MDNPGPYSLGVLPITTAGTIAATAITGLEGMLSASFQISLAYGG